METKPLWQGLAQEVNVARIAAINDQTKARRDANIEIEIQYGTYIESQNEDEAGNLIATVSPSAFFRLLNTMKRMTSNFTISETEDEISKQERVSYNRKTKNTEYYDKKRIYSSYNSYYNQEEQMFVTDSSNYGIMLAKEYNMKITVANEYAYKSESKTFRPTLRRNKKRTSFDFRYQYGGYLDLTVVEEESLIGNKENKTKYEVEFEIVESFDQYQNKIEWFSLLIIAILQDSVLPYTNSQRTEMYKYVAGLLGMNAPGAYRNLKFSMLPEARDLRLTDMVYGGIVGNTDFKYCVTHKADGVRKLMVTTPTSIWAFVPGTSDANLMYKFVDTAENSAAPFQEGFIFDGELLTKENRKDSYQSKYMFYIFDCLCQNKEDIRDRNYMERMEKALKFTEYPLTEIQTIFVSENQAPIEFKEFKIRESRINKVVTFIVKGYLSLTSVEHFFETMRLMFLQQSDLAFKQDGFMFIPITSCYNPYDPITPLPLAYQDATMYRNAPPIFKRSLTQYPDICKWKPIELRSIDFVVVKKDKEVMLKSIERKLRGELVSLNEEGRLRTFTGTKRYPLNSRIDTEHPIIKSLAPDTIVEFYWDAKRQVLTPSRIRSDKPTPNGYETAKVIWENIFQGIDQETLIGQSFQLMREYHNQIKKQLYNNSLDTRNHKVLLDIGSGKGGDINKWTDFDLIFAVEPNPEHLKELGTRLKNSKIDPHKVVIIPAKGEDYETITKVIQQKYGEKVSTVSLMLSFSFFYEEARQGVKKTIENNLEVGGEVLIMTIDGDIVEQVFRPSSGEYKEKTLKFLDAELTYEPKSGNLIIDIPNTIVRNQKERPPKLSQLFKEWKNFLPIHVSRADKQPFLNSGEKPFSNMYASFTWIYLSKEMSEIEIERIVPYEKIPRLVKGEKEYGPVEDWTFVPNGMYGISVIPSDYFYLSAVLKAIDPEYQNNNDFNFRRTYVVKVWKQILDTLSPSEKQIYQLPWNHNILKIFSRVFDLNILFVKDKTSFRFESLESKRKIVIVESYLIGQMNDKRQLQVLFERKLRGELISLND